MTDKPHFVIYESDANEEEDQEFLERLNGRDEFLLIQVVRMDNGDENDFEIVIDDDDFGPAMDNLTINQLEKLADELDDYVGGLRQHIKELEDMFAGIEFEEAVEEAKEATKQ